MEKFNYFIIIRDNGFVKPFIDSFSEIESIKSHNPFDNFLYYKLSNKIIRKLKLLSFNDIEFKERFTTLQNLLNDSRLIQKYDDIPQPTYQFYNINYVYGVYSIKFPVRTIEKKPKLNTKNISYKNRFIGKVNKKIDFHKSYKRK